jgi:hypothetical protein
MNESLKNKALLFGPGVEELWLQQKKRRRLSLNTGGTSSNYGVTTGSNLSPEISKQLGEAEQSYINGNNEEAISILSQITKQAPKLAEPYKILALIYEQIPNSDLQVLQLYLLAAIYTNKDLYLWEKVYFYAKRCNECNQMLLAINRCISLQRKQPIYYQERIRILIKLGKIKMIKEFISSYCKLFPVTNTSQPFFFLYLGDQFFFHSYSKQSSYYYQKYLSFFFKQLLFYDESTSLTFSSFSSSSSSSSSSFSSPLSASLQENLFNSLFHHRSSIDLIILHLYDIIYCIRQYCRLLLETSKFYDLIYFIETFFLFFHQLKAYAIDHQQEYLSPGQQQQQQQPQQRRSSKRKKGKHSNEEEEEMDVEDTREEGDEREVDNYDRDEEEVSNERDGIELILSEDFPMDILLLLGLTKLILQKNEKEMNEALTIITPFLKTIEENIDEIIPQRTIEYPPYNNYSSSSFFGDNSYVPMEESDDERNVTKETPMNSMFLNHDLYDFHLEAPQTKNTKKDEEEEDEEEEGKEEKTKEENELLITRFRKNRRNAIKESENIRFSLIYYLSLISSLLIENGIKSKGNRLSSLLYDSFLNMEFSHISSYSTLLLSCSYEFINQQGIEKAYVLIEKVLFINPYSLEGMIAYGYILLRKGNDDEQLLLTAIPKMESFLMILLEDIEKLIYITNRKKSQRKPREKKVASAAAGEGKEEKLEKAEKVEGDKQATQVNEEGEDISDDDDQEDDDEGNEENEKIKIQKSNEKEKDEEEAEEQEAMEELFLESGHLLDELDDMEDKKNPTNADENLYDLEEDTSFHALFSSSTSSELNLLKSLQFPLLFNKYCLHRSIFHQILEFLSYYLQIMNRISSSYYSTTTTTTTSTGSNYSPNISKKDLLLMKVSLIESLIRASKTRIKTRDMIHHQVIVERLDHFYCFKKRTLETTSPAITPFPALEAKNPLVNVIHSFSHNSHSKHSNQLAEETKEDLHKSFLSSRVGIRLYSLFLFLSEYIPIDSFFSKNEIFLFLSSFSQEIDLFEIDHKTIFQKNEKASHTLLEMKQNIHSIEKLYETLYNEKEFNENPHGLLSFLTFFHPSSLASSLSFSPFNINSNLTIASSFLSFLQARLIPSNQNENTTFPSSFSATSVANQTAIDPELQYLRKNIALRRYRGKTRQSTYSVFIDSAEKVSHECKEIAELLYSNPSDSNAWNLLQRLIVHQTINQYQQTIQQESSSSSSTSSSSENASSLPLEPFMSIIQSLYIENKIPIKPLLTEKQQKLSQQKHQQPSLTHHGSDEDDERETTVKEKVNHFPSDSSTSISSSLSSPFLASLYYLCGNEIAVYRRHNVVIEYYLKAFILNPNEPIIALSLGCYCIMLSSHPLIKDRMDYLLKGIAFLLRYQELRRNQGKEREAEREEIRKRQSKQQQKGLRPGDIRNLEEESTENDDKEVNEEIILFQETFYNTARVFHEIKFYHFASHCYRQCLQLADRYPYLMNRSTNGNQRSVTSEAAYNLVLIYKRSNAKDLCFSIMRKYLMF